MLDHKLIVFYHLAQTPNTTKVAAMLRLSQPAISKSIRELERELSITLFARTGGRLQLTPAGEYLLTATRELVDREREINFHFDQMRDASGGTLDIGASTTLAQYILPEILAAFTHTGNTTHITAISGNTDQIESEVAAGNLHLAFIEGTPTQPDLHYIPFLEDEIVLVCSTQCPTPDTILREGLHALRFVFREKGSGTYNIIRKQLREAGTDINTLQEELILGTTEGIKQYLLHSYCFALLSVYSIRNELATGKLKIVDIDGLTITRTFYAIHRQGQPDPYAQQFLDYTLDYRKRLRGRR